MPFWIEFLQSGERFAQAHPSPRPLQEVTLYFDPEGRVVDARLHFDQGEAAALPATAPPLPPPEAVRSRLRLTDNQFVEAIEAALDGHSPPGLRIPDLAAKMGRSRKSGSFGARVRKLAEKKDRLIQDEDGFVDKRR